MNNNSYICCYIKEHPDAWRDELKNKQILIKENNEHLAIFNYDIMADFSDPLVQEARGIILNLDTLDVVCWPFRKFGNFGESYADTIDWSTARVQDKIDGSIIKLWWNSIKNNWQFSTNSTIDAGEAGCASLAIADYAELVHNADNYHKIPFESLDRDKTYIFELTSPENKVVIRYEETHLWHIGTRNNNTGEESIDDIGINKPDEYSLRSLDECVEAAKNLNHPGGAVEKEGFVVVDKNWHRIKIKSPDYLCVHRMIGNGNFSKRRVIEMIKTMDNGTLDNFSSDYPEYAVYIAYYRFKMAELARLIDNFSLYTKKLYEEYSHDRAAVAREISSHPLSMFGFKTLDEKGHRGIDWIKILSVTQLEKLIPEYVLPGILDLKK